MFSTFPDQFSDPLHDRLHYEDVEKCHPEMCSVWEDILETREREKYKMDRTMLHTAVRTGKTKKN